MCSSDLVKGLGKYSGYGGLSYPPDPAEEKRVSHAAGRYGVHKGPDDMVFSYHVLEGGRSILSGKNKIGRHIRQWTSGNDNSR